MANNHGGDEVRTCTFCGRSENQVLFLIPSPRNADGYICDDCVGACAEVLGIGEAEEPTKEEIDVWYKLVRE